MMRKEAQLKKQQSIETHAYLSKPPEQQMQLKLKYGTKQLKADLAKKQFRQFKKQQLSQLKRGNPARKEFAAKSRNFEQQMAQRKIAFGSDEYNQAVQAYFPGYSPPDMGIMQARAKVVHDVSVNDNPALEKEADVMGAKAAQGKMADNPISKQAGKSVQKKEEKKEDKEKDPWKITRYLKEGHTGGYQHIFDEYGRLIILTPVNGQDVYYITNSPDTYSDKGNGARVGAGSIEKVGINDVLGGLHTFYNRSPKELHKFVNRLYRYNKQDGYDFVQYTSVKNLNKAHSDFFNNGGWMMLAVCLSPLIIEAIPFIVQASPHLISKIPKSLLVKAFKTEAGKYILRRSGENVIDSLVSYIFTGDVDMVSLGLNYVPGMGKTPKTKMLIKGLKRLIDSTVDYNIGDKELKIVVSDKPVTYALLDLVGSYLKGMTNAHIESEFTEYVYKYILRGITGSLIKAPITSYKKVQNEKKSKEEKNISK